MSTTLGKGDRVVWTPQDESWTYPSYAWGSIPPTGTQGTIKAPPHGTSWPGGGVGVKWDDGNENSYPVDYCVRILTKQRPPKRPPRIKGKGTNAGRNMCLKCGKPTKLLDWGLPAANSQYCTYCKI